MNNYAVEPKPESLTSQSTKSETNDTELSPEIMALIRNKNSADLKSASVDPLSKLGGSLAVHCRADLQNRKITEAAAMATLFRSYESLLPGKTLDKVGLVSATASGICGGVHATASALCLEMSLGLQPPPMGIILRNLLLSCQYLNDNSMHLFVLAGPDYSENVFRASNPELWDKAQSAVCQLQAVHGYQRISDILTDLNKETGKLYKEALYMVSIARKAYILLGGKYPHSKSIIPGGISFNVTLETLNLFQQALLPFANYSQKSAAIWDDVFNFMLTVQPRYEDMGKSPATMLDFGQWDHPNYYDGTYINCDIWGEKRWSTPGMIKEGKLVCDKLSQLNAGIEEHLDFSFQNRIAVPEQQLIKQDPLGNSISALHPWNKRVEPRATANGQAYSWGSSLTWRGHSFEVGAYSRLYLTAIAQKIPANDYLHSTGKNLEFCFTSGEGKTIAMQWQIPTVWNAIERNRARANALAFSYAVTLENIRGAKTLLARGENQTFSTVTKSASSDGPGVGLWGASRGFLAHWAIIKKDTIDNYQLSIPSRVNVGTRSNTLQPGPLEQALLNTPILETRFSHAADFEGIDIQRTIQSFDPCMSCTSHVLMDGSNLVVDKTIDTSFPV